MAADKPAGIDIAIFYDQAAEVAHSVNGFITNFLMALAIVVGVLLVFMGCAAGLLLCRWRSTFSAPCLSCISGDRTTTDLLGALIIALSMLVDNAIVIVEGCSSPVSKALRCWARLTMCSVALRCRCLARRSSPSSPSRRLASPGTLPGVLQIAVPGAADLLMLSWFSALTITPVLIKWWLFKTPVGRRRGGKGRSLPRQLLPWLSAGAANTAAAKTLTLVLMGALLAGAIWGFTFVRQNFFPSSNTPIFFVDLWLPYGTDINATEKMTRDIERSIAGQPGWSPPSPPSAGQYAFHSHLQRAAPVQQLRADYGADG